MKINPIRFKIEEEDKCQVIKIGKIISTDLEKMCGNKMWVFTCSAVVNGMDKVSEIKYEVEGAGGCFIRFRHRISNFEIKDIF